MHLRHRIRRVGEVVKLPEECFQSHGLIEDSEIPLGAALAGLRVVHMPRVLEFATAFASAEESGTSSGRFFGECDPWLCRWPLPCAEGDPPDFRRVRVGPSHDADLELPLPLGFQDTELLKG